MKHETLSLLVFWAPKLLVKKKKKLIKLNISKIISLTGEARKNLRPDLENLGKN